jgi:molybdopterin synthase catalytic subunit
MQIPPATFEISPNFIVPADHSDGTWGAEIRFLGIVRGTEAAATISAINYTAYLPMAEQVLQRIIIEMQALHGPHPVHIQHRLGVVAVGEPSIIITTAGKHSAETFARLQAYLHRVKTEVPIWKEFVS